MSEPPTLLLGDCFEVLQTLEAESVDACVTDPPYGLSFMGKHWDKGVPATDVWEQVFRVLKPGAHLLSFFGTRTYHRGAAAIEDAGFEIRDQIGWLYGSGFPKSLDIGKAIDRAAGHSRGSDYERRATVQDPPVTEAAKQWDGWGTALKPAWEPICVARKPLDGTVANNVLTYGVGGLNVDGCRVHLGDEPQRGKVLTTTREAKATVTLPATSMPFYNERGRFPANLIHDGSDEVLAEFAKYGERKPGWFPDYEKGEPSGDKGRFLGWFHHRLTGGAARCIPDTGTAARFFKSCEETDEEWLDRNIHLSVASIAGSNLSLRNQSVASALSYAVTSALPGGSLCTNLSQGPITNVTPNELRRIAESVTEVIPDIVQKCLLGPLPGEPTKAQNGASVAALRTQTGTMRIMIDHWRSDGSADPVTFSITETNLVHGAAASQSRIHYTAKASKDDRNDGLWDYDHTDAADMVDREPGTGLFMPSRTSRAKNHHPTVKPTSLMRYLVRLVTPKSGLVLDPFAGSGTTLIAAYREDCRAIGIELDPEYHQMASHRIDNATAQLRLPL